MISRIALFSFALLAFSGVVHADEPKPVESLPALVETALANNPEVKATAAHLQMLENKAEQAGRLEDPMLMLKIQNGVLADPLNFKRDSMTQKVIGISQQLPWYGKRKLRREVAVREALASHLLRQERILEIARMVRETYYQIWFTDKSLEILAKNIRIMDDFITLAETRYSVGQGAQQDIFKAQLERSRMLEMRITLEQQRLGLEIRMNTLLYRPVETRIGSIPEPELANLKQTTVELQGLAEKNRPLLKGMLAQIEKSEAASALGKKEYYPDFTVSFEYMQREPAMGSDGSDMYSLGVTFNLPFQRERRHAMLAESESERTMALAELNDAKNTIKSGIADLLSQMERRRRLVELYKTGIIPQAEQALESAVIGYRVGKIDFLTLLDSRLTLFNNEREYYDSLADHQMKLAQLEALVGTDLATANATADNRHQHK
ncbi:MAG: TolC family protein [Deltaproteobacteria bacterium]|nr:TolC family protein [Deltaproteobacteria bacterium]